MRRIRCQHAASWAAPDWHLQMQANPPRVGLGTNWVDVANATTTNKMAFPLSPTNGSVFFRLVL